MRACVSQRCLPVSFCLFLPLSVCLSLSLSLCMRACPSTHTQTLETTSQSDLSRSDLSGLCPLLSFLLHLLSSSSLFSYVKQRLSSRSCSLTCVQLPLLANEGHGASATSREFRFALKNGVMEMPQLQTSEHMEFFFPCRAPLDERYVQEVSVYSE